MKFLRRAAAGVLTGVMMVSALGMKAAAANTAEEVTVQFTKELDMTNAEGANVPDVIFGFEIAAGTAQEATDENPEILAGVGTPTIADVVFGEDESTTKTAVVDFSNVTFVKPGIYRYTVTEKAEVTGMVKDDITNDENPTRYLDVYVENGTDGLEITSYVLLAQEATPSYGDGNSVSYGELQKDAGYVNAYTTYDLELTKTITGAMADMNAEFTFTIAFTGPAGTSFTYGEEQIVLDENGQGSCQVVLGHEDSALIQGLPSCVTYEITEQTASKDGYQVSATVNDNSVTITKDETTTYAKFPVLEMGQTDNDVDITNNKDSITTTGVLMNVAPYVFMVAIAAVITVLFFRKKRV